MTAATERASEPPRLPTGRASLADGLPPHIAARISPEWRANEAGYWAARESLLKEFAGKWVGFAGGVVVASGDSAVKVLYAAQATRLSTFFTRCGSEDVPASRIRREVFAYDSSYGSEAMPRISLEVVYLWNQVWVKLDGVIPDTGADAIVLPWADCQALRLEPHMGVTERVGGISGHWIDTLTFGLLVRLAGTEYVCRAHFDFDSPERILGRDVLNQLVVTFDGPGGQVIVTPSSAFQVGAAGLGGGESQPSATAGVPRHRGRLAFACYAHLKRALASGAGSRAECVLGSIARPQV